MTDVNSRLDMSLDDIPSTSSSSRASGGKCYTCNQPGHLARDCPQNESSGKECYNCNKVGHLARDCRSRKTGGRSDLPSFECYVCGGRGHLARDCPTPQPGGRGRSTARTGGRGGSACHVCGDEGHFARDCPDNENAEKTCYKCQRQGHMARDCKSRDVAPRGRSGRGDECYTCGRTGHLARDCRNGNSSRSRSPGGRGGRNRGGSHDGATGYKDKREHTTWNYISSCKVYVGNLAYSVSWQDLKDHMRSAGDVVHADILMGRDGRSRGCGVVTFGSSEDAQTAIDELTDSDLNGRKIFVREDREA